MGEAQRIAQNTTYLTMALVVQKVIAFFFFLAVAHRLGGAETGTYVAAFAFSSFFSIFIDLGLGPVMTRELARHPEKTERYLSAILAIKMILAVLSFGALLSAITVLQALHAQHPPFGIIVIAGLSMILDSFLLTGTSLFRSWQNLWFESVVIVINKFAVLAIGLIVLWVAPSASNVALAVLAGGFCSLGLLASYVRLRVRGVQLRLDRAILKELWRLAKPFAIAGFFSATYAQFDSILLSVLKGNGAVGLYSVASKTMNAFLFIPAAFSAALYPAMSVAFEKNPERLRELLQQALRYLLLISLPIAVGAYALAPQYVSHIGSDFSRSALAVQILLPTLIFTFLAYPIGALLNATNRQHWQTSLIAGGTIANALLNVFLIPRFSFVGASVAWSITNVGVFIAGLILVRRVGVSYPYRLFGLTLVRAVIACVVLYAAIVFLTHFNIIVPVAVGSALYVLVLLITREITSGDIRVLRSVVSKPSVDVA